MTGFRSKCHKKYKILKKKIYLLKKPLMLLCQPQACHPWRVITRQPKSTILLTTNTASSFLLSHTRDDMPTKRDTNAGGIFINHNTSVLFACEHRSLYKYPNMNVIASACVGDLCNAPVKTNFMRSLKRVASCRLTTKSINYFK